jgi:hypothetical protein
VCPLLGDIDLIAEARAKDVSEFLQMLNTSSDIQSSKVHGAPQKEWKVRVELSSLTHLRKLTDWFHFDHWLDCSSAL